MDIIYRINGSDLSRDRNVAYSPQIGWKVKANGNEYVIEEPPTIDLDSEEQTLYVELKKSEEYLGAPANGIAKCVSVFSQGKSLTIGKDYPILKQNDTHFVISNDKNIKVAYKHGNSQFTIY